MKTKYILFFIVIVSLVLAYSITQIEWNSELTNYPRVLFVASFIGSFVGGIVWFIPTFVANKRKHYQAKAIFWANLLIGWNAIVWVILIIYSFWKTDCNVVKNKGDLS